MPDVIRVHLTRVKFLLKLSRRLRKVASRCIRKQKTLHTVSRKQQLRFRSVVNSSRAARQAIADHAYGKRAIPRKCQRHDLHSLARESENIVSSALSTWSL